MEEEKIKIINKNFYRPESFPTIVADKVYSDTWNGNLHASQRMTDVNLRKIKVLNVSATYVVIEACEIMVSRLGKCKQDLSMELLTPLVNSLAFIGKTAKDTNQLGRDILKSRLPAKIKRLTKNILAESEPLFGDDLNNRISQINNIDNVLAKPAFRTNKKSSRYHKIQAPYNTTSNNHQQSKNGYPPRRRFATGRKGNK